MAEPGTRLANGTVSHMTREAALLISNHYCALSRLCFWCGNVDPLHYTDCPFFIAVQVIQATDKK
jgi:hypothetical protein